MKVVVTGANGNVGGELTERCRLMGDDVAAFGRAELDISDQARVLDVIASQAPDVVINCAAWTDVDGCELDPEKNFAINARGVENLALACRETGAAFITISTDFVFDGEKDGFYTQEDRPNPINQYGRAKLAGEVLAPAAWDRTTIVRAGWIFGPRGKNFLSKVGAMLAAGERVTAIADSFGTPTYAPDLAERLRELAILDKPGIYHAANAGDGTSYAEFARAAAKDASLVEDISAASLNRPALRPRNTKLRCLLSEKVGLAPMRHWQDALKDHLARKA